MRSRQVEPSGPRTWVLVFELGDDPIAELERFARENGVHGAHFTAIGAFSEATIAFFDWDARRYREIPVREQVEVVTLAGDVADSPEGPKVHGHAVLGRSDGSAVGGHLLRARVRPTLELVLQETPAHLVRVHDPRSGLALIDPDRS